VAVPLFIQFRAGLVASVPAAPADAIELILGADQARITAWGAAIQMWLAEPLFGHGFLTYKELAPVYGDPRLGSPHNEILRLFAEEGIVGGLAGIAFVGLLVRELARRPGPIGSGLLAGAIAYWIAAMFNNPMLFIQVSAVAFTFFGFGLAAPYRDPLSRGSVSRADAEPEPTTETSDGSVARISSPGPLPGGRAGHPRRPAGSAA
jgi:O-antigen ligase